MNWEALLVPALLSVGGVLGGIAVYVFRSTLDALHRAQERLASDRRKPYADLIDPYTQLFVAIRTDGDVKTIEKIQKILLSLEYRRTAGQVILIGSDDVVHSYNDLMQYFYETEAAGPEARKDVKRGFEMLRLYGLLLLAIRESLGNSRTRVDEWDLLRYMITDLDDVLTKYDVERRRRRWWISRRPPKDRSRIR